VINDEKRVLQHIQGKSGRDADIEFRQILTHFDVEAMGFAALR
jgi:hypothetical protein